MSVGTAQPLPVPEDVEPKASMAAVPVWMFVLLPVLLWGGMVYFDENSGWFEPAVYIPYTSTNEVALYQPVRNVPDWWDDGRAKFNLVCAACHDESGAGKPNLAPPFAGSDWVTGDPNRLIRIPLYGLSGPVTVHGQQYTFAVPMGPMGSAFTPEELAHALSYMRNSFGNKADPITPEQVKAIKATVGARAQPFTPDELQSVQ